MEFQRQTKISAVGTASNSSSLAPCNLLSANTFLFSSLYKKEFTTSQTAETSLTCVLQ